MPDCSITVHSVRAFEPLTKAIRQEEPLGAPRCRPLESFFKLAEAGLFSGLLKAHSSCHSIVQDPHVHGGRLSAKWAVSECSLSVLKRTDR